MEEKLNTRRKVLIGMTAAVGAAGVPFAAVPFLSAWNPSAKAKAVGAPVKVDISKIQVGQKIQVAWRKQPVFVIRHSPEALENLSKIEDKLDDPQSINIDEPYRDINPTDRLLRNSLLLLVFALILAALQNIIQKWSLSHGMKHGLEGFSAHVMDLCSI